MKKTIGLLAVIFNLSGNSCPRLPAFEYNPDSLPNRILIINAFDAAALHARNSKKELFLELSDSLKQYLSDKIRYRDEEEPVIFANLLTGPLASDSNIIRLMSQNSVSRSIVIRNLNVFFDQTDVEVSGTKESKNRVASYDICSVITYDLYSDTIKIKSSKTSFCEFFTNRNVLSGLLASGPDVVGKKKYTFSIVSKNASKYLTDIEDELFHH